LSRPKLNTDCILYFKVLYPSYSVRDLRIWSNLYVRDARYTPPGSSEHPSSTSSLVPGRLRSYEDLSSSLTNGLHRSTSDPSLSGSLSLESSSITIRTGNTANSTNPSTNSTQSNRLQNSTSTNSLFGPPHHLGTLNGSNHNMTNNPVNGVSTPTSPNTNPNVTPPSTITIPTNNPQDSPDNRIKRQSFTTDDSAPDITQLALSFQRFPLNVNSVDNIIRTMSRPRKHTNSTSSTGSSLSEAWSLTKINSHDSNQTQRTVC
jgi:hypothetical protein